jgi:hypothetical protein
MDDVKDEPAGGRGLSRRSFVRMSSAIGTMTFANGLPFLAAIAQKSGGSRSKGQVSGRRKLGTLEVFSIGLGCQDFTGTFYATAPNRADMIILARTAHDNGVTLFDAAEAYGPLEVERILGEALAPIRNQVVLSFQIRLEHRSGHRQVAWGPEQPSRSRPAFRRRNAEALQDRSH